MSRYPKYLWITKTIDTVHIYKSLDAGAHLYSDLLLLWLRIQHLRIWLTPNARDIGGKPLPVPVLIKTKVAALAGMDSLQIKKAQAMYMYRSLSTAWVPTPGQQFWHVLIENLSMPEVGKWATWCLPAKANYNPPVQGDWKHFPDRWLLLSVLRFPSSLETNETGWSSLFNILLSSHTLSQKDWFRLNKAAFTRKMPWN